MSSFINNSLKNLMNKSSNGLSNIQYTLKSVESDMTDWSSDDKKLLVNLISSVNKEDISEKVVTCFVDKLTTEYTPDDVFKKNVVNKGVSEFMNNALLSCDDSSGEWKPNHQKKFIDEFVLKWNEVKSSNIFLSENIIKCLLKNIMKKYTYIQFSIKLEEKQSDFVNTIDTFIINCKNNINKDDCLYNSDCPMNYECSSDKKCVPNTCRSNNNNKLSTIIISIILLLGVCFCIFIFLLVWYLFIRDKSS